MIVKLIKWLLGIGYLTDDNRYFFFNEDNAKDYSSYTYLKGANIDYKIKFFSWKRNLDDDLYEDIKRDNYYV